jgi:hypothetical protein
MKRPLPQKDDGGQNKNKKAIGEASKTLAAANGAITTGGANLVLLAENKSENMNLVSSGTGWKEEKQTNSSSNTSHPVLPRINKRPNHRD